MVQWCALCRRGLTMAIPNLQQVLVAGDGRRASRPLNPSYAGHYRAAAKPPITPAALRSHRPPRTVHLPPPQHARRVRHGRTDAAVPRADRRRVCAVSGFTSVAAQRVVGLVTRSTAPPTWSCWPTQPRSLHAGAPLNQTLARNRRRCLRAPPSPRSRAGWRG